MEESAMERRLRLVRRRRIVGVTAFVVILPSVFFLLLGLFDPNWRHANRSINGYEAGALVFGGVISLVVAAAIAIYSRVWVEIFFDRKVEAVRAEEVLANRERRAREAADRRRRMHD